MFSKTQQQQQQQHPDITFSNIQELQQLNQQLLHQIRVQKREEEQQIQHQNQLKRLQVSFWNQKKCLNFVFNVTVIITFFFVASFE